MTRDQAKAKLKDLYLLVRLLEGYVNEERVQCLNFYNEWEDIEQPNFDNPLHKYRIYES